MIPQPDGSAAAGRGVQASSLIERLSLRPHPEGGWYREIHRSPIRVEGPRGSRSALTTIYYLLERGELSRWHVVEADEVWHLYCGAPLELLAYDPTARSLERRMLATPHDPPAGNPAPGSAPRRIGEPLPEGEPVAVIGRGIWQAARSLGDFSLAGCSVGPGFEFADFRFVASLPDHAGHFVGPMQGLASLL